MSVNLVMLVGNLGRRPEHRIVQKLGSSVLSFSMATNRSKWTTDGWEQITDWHKVLIYGDRAEELDRTRALDKGSSVYVEGRLRTREWRDRDGNRRWTTEVIAEVVEPLSVPRWKRQQQGDG